MANVDKKKDQPRRPWRDNIEAVTMAIVMAVMLKYFAVEAYKIPTGSMQPTLMGNEDTGIFDRILVDKLSFHYRDPERFEVVVFKYPLDRSKNFIKRLCGMPGEDFAIRDGDLFTRPDAQAQWTPLRRPRPVQRDTWRRLDPDEPRYSAWRAVDGGRGWEVRGRAAVRARGDGSVRLPGDGKPIADSYRDGYPGKMGSKLSRARAFTLQNPVGDVRLTGEVTALANTRAVTIELCEGRVKYRFVLPGPAADADARATIVAEGIGGDLAAPITSVSAQPWKLEAGKSLAFSVQNMDDLLELELDGEFVAALEIPAADDQTASFTLRVEGEGADFDELEVYRDIYYTSGHKSREFKIPAGHYVMLGDNTLDSSDSREWTLISYRWDAPPSNGEWVRGNLFDSQNPISVPGAEGGPRVFFRDEWGDLHDFPARADSRGELTPAPYVPRELILGRAVTVFWPLWPFTGDPAIWRLKWVR